MLKDADGVNLLRRLSELHRALDIASTTNWDTASVELEYLSRCSGSWVENAVRRVRDSHRLAPVRSIVQLQREVIEYSSLDGVSPKIDETALVRLILSITSEQNLRDEFEGDAPTYAEMVKLSQRTSALSLEQTIAEIRTMLPDEVAALLFNWVSNLEIAQATTVDTWFASWPAKVTEPELGTSPAEAFKRANGIDLVDFLVMGEAIHRLSNEQREIEFTQQSLVAEGVSVGAVEFLATHLALGPERYVAKLSSDRARGDLAYQRYTLSQYPFLEIQPGRYLLLRHQWGVDRFFGGQLYWQTYGSFMEESRYLGEKFSEAMNHLFEKIVGEVITRIAQNSDAIADVVGEVAMQDRWKSKGKEPSVCDWVLPAGIYCIEIDATNHPLNFKLAQGLGSQDEYDDDMRKVFSGTNKGKFKQLASTIRILRKDGWEGLVGNLRAVEHVPLVIVPDNSIPNTSSTDIDLQLRARPFFAHFIPRVMPPAVVQLSNLHIMEGVSEYYRIDFVDLLISWRRESMRGVPVTLQYFLESRGLGRMMSSHIVGSHKKFRALMDGATGA
ncbi:hypothetical protein [Rhodococcus maanshanensis]|uniref:Uncharacterized protein n=1 Tax=Rhodococcus maanshanensis TaxID=183556 RepID=A0A1H7F3Q2_9NOCA|nr:hypothetical protein [Rhodococcus maanshanensis]SEK20719.1 hypothetical protein SAMN05444583_10151 [Rhodococcus maanshanensis]